jgi:excisionase family DNA binding protein
MSKQARNLTKAEIQRAFAGGSMAQNPVILSPTQLAKLLGLSPKTIYEWQAKGRLDGTFRKRGKHILIWRDRALDRIFNGPDWPSK